MSDRRQAILILGMHRGGTSAAAGALACLGLKQPRTPLPPAADNPNGFFESLPVVLTNQCLFDAAGCTWSSCLDLEITSIQRQTGPDAELAMLQLLQHEFGQNESFLLKDPRLCLVLPLWWSTLNKLEVDERILIIVRHPAEVCRSLATRDAIPEDSAVSLWLHHLLEAERFSRGRHRAVLLYDDLVDNWRTALVHASDLADIKLPAAIDDFAVGVDTFLAKENRHHRSKSSSAAVGPAKVKHLVAEAWLALQHLVRSPDDATALDCLDHTHSQFADWRKQNVGGHARWDGNRVDAFVGMAT